MTKCTLIGLSLAGMMTAGVAFAADKPVIDPGKGAGPTDAVTNAVPTMKPEMPAPAGPTVAATGEVAKGTCTQEDISATVTKAGTMTDKEKQKMTMGHVEMAQKSMGQKDMAGCAMHLKAASDAMGTMTK
jgi:hypothetical protein